MSINDYREYGYADVPKQTTLGAGRNTPQYPREDYIKNEKNPIEAPHAYTAFDALNSSDILIGALSERIDMLAKVIDSVLEENYPQNKQYGAIRPGNTTLINRINHQADVLENYLSVVANLIDRVRL